jgi:hypothetical protein
MYATLYVMAFLQDCRKAPDSRGRNGKYAASIKKHIFLPLNHTYFNCLHET